VLFAQKNLPTNFFHFPGRKLVVFVKTKTKWQNLKQVPEDFQSKNSQKMLYIKINIISKMMENVYVKHEYYIHCKF
jgi:hypothetical protein